VATDAAFTNVVASSLTDTVNKTSWTPGTSLNYNTTYYVRALHRSVDPISSGYGASISFTTTAVPTIGASYGGGYYAGQIKLKAGQYDYETATTLAADKTYNLIIAPRATGQYGGDSPTNVQYKTTASGDVDTIATLLNDGRYITETYNDADHPAFQWAAALNIGGYTDWYIPARDEIEILYRAFKPDTSTNTTAGDRPPVDGPAANSSTDDPDMNYGTNLNSVPMGSAYTAVNPAQTTISAFQTGGSEALSTASLYWSATEKASDPFYAWRFAFSTGGFNTGSYKTGGNYVRAVRRVAA
jgi:hypothetical protein